MFSLEVLCAFSYVCPGYRTSSEDRGTIGAGEGRNLVETPAFKIEGGLKTYLTFKSCTPAELRMDKFTVWQFEVHEQLFHSSLKGLQSMCDFARLIIYTTVL